jgi:hypothetical protein
MANKISQQFETATGEQDQSRIRLLADRDGSTSRQYQSAAPIGND